MHEAAPSRHRRVRNRIGSRKVSIARRDERVDSALVRAGSPDPPVLCDRMSPSPRSLPRHLKTSGRPNGGVGRPCPNQLVQSPRNAEFKQPETVRARTGSVGSALSWVSMA